MSQKRALVAAVLAVAGTLSLGLAELGQAVIKPSTITMLDSFVRETRRAPFAKRPAGALGGHALMQRVAGLPVHRRESVLLAEIMSGNVPDSLRTLVPVRLTTTDARGRTVIGTAWVLPDYLAVGSNEDNVRVPLSLEGASRIALQLGMALPTTKIVREIQASADLRLTPQPLPAGSMMTSTDYMVRHNDMIETALKQALGHRSRAGHLIVGHKKDVVMTPKLVSQADRVAIFGWFRPNGTYIQPLSTVHDRMYADYSHGIRLVSPSLFVDGRDVPIEDALVDRVMASLVSREGRFNSYAAVLEAAAGR